MLSHRDKMVLDFERSWWMLPGPKDRAIREHLGIGAGLYYETLRRLVEDPDADRYDPLTIRRLRRVRTKKAAAARQDTVEQ
jgi:hypothetical protein